MSARARLLGLAADPALPDFRTRPSRFSGLFRALAEHVDVVDVEVPRLSALERYSAAALAFRRDRTAWRGRTGLSSRLFRARTRAAERVLAARAHEYDVILEWQSLFAPGARLGTRPYLVYSDNIYPLTLRHHPAWAPLSRGETERWLANERDVIRNAHAFFAMSEFLRGAVIADYGIEAERVVRVGAGCNSLSPTLDGRRWDTLVALTVAANWSMKGGPTLLASWERVRRRLPDAELWIAGPREPHAPEQPGVRWLGFVGDRAKIAQLYDRASVFVLPSYYEPWGHVLLEAMGHGLPCVGTQVGAMPELIEEGLSGFRVEAGEEEPLADALVALLGDPRRAEAFGRRGYDRVSADLTWERVAERMAPHLLAAAQAIR